MKWVRLWDSKICEKCLCTHCMYRDSCVPKALDSRCAERKGTKRCQTTACKAYEEEIQC